MSIVNFNSSRRAHTEGTPLQINSSLDPKGRFLKTRIARISGRAERIAKRRKNF